VNRNFPEVHASSDAAEIWLLKRILWFLLLILAAFSVTDPDLWGHVRFGLDFIGAWSLPHTEIYSYTSDLPFMDHEWLGDVANALAYTAGGTLGLIVMKTVVVGTAYLIVLRAYREAPWVVPEVITIGVAILCLPLTVTIRPQIWSFLFVAVLCRVPLDARVTWFIPVLLALWANLHGGWIVGLALLVGRYAGECWRRPRVITRAMTVVAASVLMTLVNAYGIEIWRFLSRTVRLERSDITEWLPIWTGRSTHNLSGWLIASVVVAVYAPRVLRTRPEVLAIVVGLGYAAQRVQRLVPLFILTTVLLLAPTICEGMISLKQPSAPIHTIPGRRAIEWFSLAVVVLLSLWTLGPRVTCIGPQPEESRPDFAAAAALRNRSGRLAVEFDWGEYAIWSFGPKLRVSLDGRREASYSERVLAEQREVAAGSAVGLNVLDRDRPEFVWMRRTRTNLLSALPAHAYRIDILTDRSFIAVRSDLPALKGVADLPAAACFPGP